MSEENKAIVRKVHEGISNGNLDTIDECYAPDAVYHGSGEMANADRDTLRQFLGGVIAASSDFKVTKDDLLSDGDKVIYRHTYSGTHTGEFMGIPTTGETFSVRSIGIVRLSGGKIVEEWENVDELGMMQQLGVIPSE